MELKEYENNYNDLCTKYTYYEIPTSDCVFHGPCRKWYKGQLQSDENFAHDKRHGPQTYWPIDGLANIEYWLNGSMTTKSKYEEFIIMNKGW